MQWFVMIMVGLYIIILDGLVQHMTIILLGIENYVYKKKIFSVCMNILLAIQHLTLLPEW